MAPPRLDPEGAGLDILSRERSQPLGHGAIGLGESAPPRLDPEGVGLDILSPERCQPLGHGAIGLGESAEGGEGG